MNGESEPSPARPAATVVVVRDRAQLLEVLLVRRNLQQRFMGGFWVFPGGAVDRSDGSGDVGERNAAVRELAEEVGITGVRPRDLVRFSRWITPIARPIRFDTHFFLTRMPALGTVRIDGREIVDHRWLTPNAALQALDRAEIELVLPTIRHLQQLATFSSVDALLAATDGTEIVAITPRVIESGGSTRVVLPGDSAYAEVDD